MTPIVAVVGRPNVGKSTLFNRLAGKSLAIVHDQPGVTRDRHYASAHLHGRNVTLVDTGGFDPDSDDPMQQGITRHVRAAIAEADVIVCVLDGLVPPAQADLEAVRLLRKSDKPVVYVANKLDRPGKLGESSELYALGLPELIPVSAAHGLGTGELAEAVVAHLPKVTAEPDEEDERTPRIALLGRPNAGKSSLFNRLSGSERSLVDSRPGTTRDPVDSRITVEGRSYLVVDTAGIRRRSKVERGIELVSVLRAIRAVERANVVMLLCDASEGVSEQDARLLGLCVERRRAIVVGLNKIDLLDKAARKRSLEQAQSALAFAKWVPLVPLSAKTGAGVPELMRAVGTAADEVRRRVSTAELNRFFRSVLERQPPPTHKGKAPRIYFLTQVEASPPLFVAWASFPESIKASYQRFVENQIRKAFGFQSVPVHVTYRERERRDRPPPRRKQDDE